MTAFSKTTPVGIDAPIHRIITSMERHLPTEWGVNSTTCRFYGRADVNDEKITWSNGNDSVKLGYNDKYNFQSYFTIEYPTDTEGYLNVAIVNLYCHGNISKLFTSITTHTADAELMQSIKENVGRHVEDVFDFDIIKVAYPEVSFKMVFEIRYHA